MIELVLITCLVCFIVDLSGIIDVFKRKLSKWIVGNKEYEDFTLKPFDCSLCMTWWICLLYIIIIGSFTLTNIFYIVILAYYADSISSILIFIKDLIGNTINKINSYFK